uniref:Polyprotein n=1 Tax=Haemonchus placei TaxID=6290 RepID=A0A0N4WJH3_HAEPC
LSTIVPGGYELSKTSLVDGGFVKFIQRSSSYIARFTPQKQVKAMSILACTTKLPPIIAHFLLPLARMIVTS